MLRGCKFLCRQEKNSVWNSQTTKIINTCRALLYKYLYNALHFSARSAPKNRRPESFCIRIPHNWRRWKAVYTYSRGGFISPSAYIRDRRIYTQLAKMSFRRNPGCHSCFLFWCYKNKYIYIYFFAFTKKKIKYKQQLYVRSKISSKCWSILFTTIKKQLLWDRGSSKLSQPLFSPLEPQSRFGDNPLKF